MVWMVCLKTNMQPVKESHGVQKQVGAKEDKEMVSRTFVEMVENKNKIFHLHRKTREPLNFVNRGN